MSTVANKIHAVAMAPSFPGQVGGRSQELRQLFQPYTSISTTTTRKGNTYPGPCQTKLSVFGTFTKLDCAKMRGPYFFSNSSTLRLIGPLSPHGSSSKLVGGGRHQTQESRNTCLQCWAFLAHSFFLKLPWPVAGERQQAVCSIPPTAKLAIRRSASHRVSSF